MFADNHSTNVARRLTFELLEPAVQPWPAIAGLSSVASLAGFACYVSEQLWKDWTLGIIFTAIAIFPAALFAAVGYLSTRARERAERRRDEQDVRRQREESQAREQKRRAALEEATRSTKRVLAWKLSAKRISQVTAPLALAIAVGSGFGVGLGIPATQLLVGMQQKQEMQESAIPMPPPEYAIRLGGCGFYRDLLDGCEEERATFGPLLESSEEGQELYRQLLEGCEQQRGAFGRLLESCERERAALREQLGAEGEARPSPRPTDRTP